ncbi:ATP-binding protein [Neobacillus niacini]|uniref:ATP-binding protein n=1 Tax=Neobacillus niacini TaxID=86668 RepID=UPI0030001AA3
MDREDLKTGIQLLIASKREGDYWDFKEEHHSNKADLLHDIICMANNRADRDGYIIFGISNDFEVMGLEGDLNRRNQQNIIDFLRAKKFSGGIRPIIELKSLYIHGKELDVLIVKNSTDTPYYLTVDFPERGRTVRANHIYTRVGDTNTPINESADINHVEYLWKKRFLLNRPPLEQIHKRLDNKEEWKSEGDTYYNVYNPEFTLQLRDDEDFGRPEFYSYLMMNESTSYGSLIVSCFGTTLYNQQFVVLDGGRYLTVIPKWGFIGNQFRWEETYAYKYFIKGNLDYSLHLFLLSEDNHEALWARDHLYSGIIIYNSELERELFEEFLNQNEELIIEAMEKDKDSYNWLKCSEDLEKQDVARKIKTGMALKGLLKEFRSHLRQETLM